VNSKPVLGILGVLILVCGYVYWPRDDEYERDLPERYPVQGSVSYNGEAPLGAYVILTPLPLENNQWDTLIPRGRVEEDGTYSVQSFEINDGVPTGKYAVTIAWTGFPDPNIKPDADRWKGKYNKPAEPLHTIEVIDSAVLVPPIELTGPEITLGAPKIDEKLSGPGS